MPKFTTPTSRGVAPRPATPPPPAAKASAGRTPKSPPPTSSGNPGGVPFMPEAGEGSGAYMRRLMRSGHDDSAVILAAVHANFPGSKAGPSDVAWNRVKVRKEDGGAPPPKATTPPPQRGATGKRASASPADDQPDLPFEGGSPVRNVPPPTPAAANRLPAPLTRGITESGLRLVTSARTENKFTIVILQDPPPGGPTRKF